MALYVLINIQVESRILLNPTSSGCPTTTEIHSQKELAEECIYVTVSRINKFSAKGENTWFEIERHTVYLSNKNFMQT